MKKATSWREEVLKSLYGRESAMLKQQEYIHSLRSELEEAHQALRLARLALQEVLSELDYNDSVQRSLEENERQRTLSSTQTVDSLMRRRAAGTSGPTETSGS